MAAGKLLTLFLVLFTDPGTGFLRIATKFIFGFLEHCVFSFFGFLLNFFIKTVLLGKTGAGIAVTFLVAKVVTFFGAGAVIKFGDGESNAHLAGHLLHFCFFFG